MRSRERAAGAHDGVACTLGMQSGAANTNRRGNANRRCGREPARGTRAGRYRATFPELESLVLHPIDYARVVKAIGNEMARHVPPPTPFSPHTSSPPHVIAHAAAVTPNT